MTGLRPQKANGFECVDDDSTPSKERAICVGSIIILLALLFCMFGVHVVEGDIPRETTGMRPRHGPIAPVSPPKRGRGTDMGTEDLHRMTQSNRHTAGTARRRPSHRASGSPARPRRAQSSGARPAHGGGGMAWHACGFRSVVFAGPVRAVTPDAHPRRGAAFGAIGRAAHRSSRFNRVHGSRSRLAVARVRPVLTLIPMRSRSEWCRRWCASRVRRPHRGARVSRRRAGRGSRDADVDLGLPVRHIGKPKLHTGDRD